MKSYLIDLSDLGEFMKPQSQVSIQVWNERGIKVRSMFTKISFQRSVASSETVYCCSISIYLVYTISV